MKEFTDFQEKLARNCPDIRILYNEPMAKHTSFRIGGAAEAMARTITAARTIAISFFMFRFSFYANC